MPSTPRRRLVLVGNGMAGLRALEEILARAPDAFAITVFGAEPQPGYNRILLSAVLAGEKQFVDIVTHDGGWYAAHGIELIAGEPVAAIDRAARRVIGAHGTTRDYDVLLLATGSLPVMLPLPGAGLPGVTGFRDMADVVAMQHACRAGGSAVVIGGGLLGLEAAHGLARSGMAVTVLHLLPTLMERQLDPVSADLLCRDLTARGISVLTEASTRAILGTDRVQAVALDDGREIAADLVVMAVGIRPNIALARDSGLSCGRGIIVDDAMRSSDPHIFALGECVQHAGQVVGLVAPIWTMATICADHVTGVADSAYRPPIDGTRLKVTGIDMLSAGDFLGDASSETITFRDHARALHKRLVLRDGRLVGAVLYGDARDGARYCDLIRDAPDVEALRDELAFPLPLSLAAEGMVTPPLALAAA